MENETTPQIQSNITGQRSANTHQVISEQLVLTIDEETELIFTMKYDPTSLLDEFHRVRVAYRKGSNMVIIGEIKLETELEPFLARLLKVWGTSYDIVQRPFVATPVVHEEGDAAVDTQPREFRPPGT